MKVSRTWMYSLNNEYTIDLFAVSWRVEQGMICNVAKLFCVHVTNYFYAKPFNVFILKTRHL